jgi:uncharacterized protein (DUF1697 family)
MTVYIGLLRAVNVGVGAQVRMEELRGLLRRMGLEEVQTLLQSGNVVFRGPRGKESELEELLAEGILREFRVRTEVFVRSAEEWRSVVSGNPFPREAKDDPSHLVVAALQTAPRADRWPALAAIISGRERVRGFGRHAYIVYPDGIGRSRFTMARIENCLGTSGTARNWNTVTKLAAIASAMDPS